jgi:hypothetical protein
MYRNSSQLQRSSLVVPEQKQFPLHILGKCNHLLPKTPKKTVKHMAQFPWKKYQSLKKNPNLCLQWESVWQKSLSALIKAKAILYLGPFEVSSRQQIGTQKNSLEKQLKILGNVWQWIHWQHDAVSLPNSTYILEEYMDLSQLPHPFLSSALQNTSSLQNFQHG